MIYIQKMILLIQFLTTFVYCSLNTINPAYYLWMDFSAKVPVLLVSSGKYITNIPCLARIGQCTCSYTVLPPGWQASSTGQLTIPKIDATKSGTFALQGTCKEKTGQKMDVNLVALIENSFLSVTDTSDFFKKNNYASQSKPTQYQTSLLVKDIPDGFLPIQQLQRVLSSQTVGNITSVVNEIIFKYAPCRSKIKYLTSVKDLLTKMLNNNNDILVIRQNQINSIQNNLTSFKINKQISMRRSGIQAQIEDLKKKIQQANILILQINLDLLNLKKFQQNTQKSMKNYPISTEKLQNSSTILREKQIDILNKDLQNNFNTNLNSNRTILTLNIQQLLNGLNSKQLQTSFALNLQLLVKTQIDLENTNNKLNELYYLRSQTNSFISAIDKQIAELKKKIIKENEKIINKNKIDQIKQDNPKIRKNIESLEIIKRNIGICKN